MTAQSANEILKETESNKIVDPDGTLHAAWEVIVRRTVEAIGATMEDKIFIMNGDGKSYDIVLGKPDNDYDRAMQGV